jgi:hypothetical protein
MTYYTDSLIDYEPSAELKEQWLKTRKAKKKYGEVTLPGLFMTDNYAADRMRVLIALGIEMLGFILMIVIASANYLIIGTVGAFVAIDVILAIALHRKQGEICVANNNVSYWAYKEKYKLEDDASEKRIAWEKKLHELENWSFGKIFKVCIWGIAILKSIGFFVLLSGSYVFAILALVLYLMVAYIHCNHTGFAYHHFIFLRQSLQEQNLHLEAIRENRSTQNTVTEPRIEPIEPMNVHLTEVHIRKTSREGNESASDKRENAIYPEAKDENGVPRNWKFKTWGLLSDDDLHTLAFDKDAAKEARDFIAIEGLNIQLNILRVKNAQHN